MTTFAVTSVNSLCCQVSTCLRIWLEVALHPVNANRNAVHERERLRVFREHGGEHAWDNASRIDVAPHHTGSSYPFDACPASIWIVHRRRSCYSIPATA